MTWGKREREAGVAKAYEAVVIPGLEPFATEELRQLPPGAFVKETAREGRLSVKYRGEFRRFEELKSVVAMHTVLNIDAARPSALLGHENFSQISQRVREIIGASPRGSFETLRLSAAGSNSAVLRRFTSELADELGLEVTSGPSHLEMALRRSEGDRGWEILLRLTSKPLSSRAWRVCDYPGALNATIANVMVRLTEPKPGDIFVNSCCGSGTLMAERMRYGAVEDVLGFDISDAALGCAQENLRTLSEAKVALVKADAGRLPLPDASVSTIVADPPFGMLLREEGEASRALYAALLREAARVLKSGGSVAIISTRRRLVQELLEVEERSWSRVQSFDLKLPSEAGYITPAIFILRRR